MDRTNNRPGRIQATTNNHARRHSRVLPPDVYIQRGDKVLRTLKDALHTLPHRDVDYPHWQTRYTNVDGTHSENIPNADFNQIFRDRQMSINGNGTHWSSYRVFSKGAVQEQTPDNLTDAYLVAGILVSARTGTMIVTMANSNADIDIPNVQTQRLFNSEIMYQIWRDACTVQMEHGISLIKTLKNVIITSIVNFGTNWSIRDVLVYNGLQEKVPRDNIARITLDDPSSEDFQMLMGTDNGRPVGMMCADHVQTLGAKTVKNIHVWYPYERSIADLAALAFELEEYTPTPGYTPTPASASVPVPGIARRPTVSDKLKAGAKKVFGSLNCAS